MNLDDAIEALPGIATFRSLSAATLRRLLNRKPKECTWCGVLVSGRRSLWCSDNCVQEFLLRCDARRAAEFVTKRDAYICQICKHDTKAAESRYRVWARTQDAVAVRQGGYSKEFPGCNTVQRVREALRCGRGRWREVDHIVPVMRGGGLCGPDNLRLLCGTCHAEVTKALVTKKTRRPKAKRKKRS